MERRLGRGLGTLLGTTADSDVPGTLGLDQIDPNPFQPRTVMDPVALEELRDSIRQHGVLQPVVVRLHGDRYQLIAGERRWRAARLAGLEAVPVVIREAVSDADMLELALVENLQRRDLDPIERARGFQALMSGLGITQEAVAVKVGLKRTTVTNHLRLLELPQRVQEAVARGLVTMGHARALLAMTEPTRIEELMEECVRRELSVRDTERMVREALHGQSPSDPPSAPPEAARPAWVATLERRLQDALATKVRLEVDAEYRGEVRLSFFNKQDLNRLTDRLAPAPTLA
jgi:ParB family chromosome partitioning protein